METGTAVHGMPAGIRRLSPRTRLVVLFVALVVLVPVGVLLGTRPIVGPNAPTGQTIETARVPARGGVAPLVGHEAPPFTATSLDGQVMALAQFRGQPVFVNFWATWCAPCRLEMPHIETLYRQHRDRGLVVLAISLDDAGAKSEVQSYIATGSKATGPYTFPVLLDPHQEIAQRYKLFGVPVSFFIDVQGVIRAVHPGAMTRDAMAEKLRSILPPA